MDQTFTIGRAARKAGVNVQTVRYYERRGFVRPSGRRESGYRLYGPEAVRRILFIKRAQELGFSLRDVGRLLGLSADSAGRCRDVRRKAEAHLADVREKIARLKSIEESLSALVRTCLRKGRTDPCPILKSLEVQRR